ncbi:unknown [Alistipes sp. CAG:29]|nr:unknown [Alistipes sp. CAG:29]
MNNHSMRTKPLMEWLKNASAPAQREDGIGKGAFANFL